MYQQVTRLIFNHFNLLIILEFYFIFIASKGGKLWRIYEERTMDQR